MKVAEPEPGRVLTQSDMDSSAVTTFGGLFERLFAPRLLRGIYADELKRLDAYAREHHSS